MLNRDLNKQQMLVRCLDSGDDGGDGDDDGCDDDGYGDDDGCYHDHDDGSDMMVIMVMMSIVLMIMLDI